MNYENQLIFGENMDSDKVGRFLGTQCVSCFRLKFVQHP